MSHIKNHPLARRIVGFLILLLSLTAVLSVTRHGLAWSLPDGNGVLSPQVDQHFVRQVSLTTNDLAYNPATHLLYASVPSSAGVTGNSIQSLDPATGVASAPVFVGSEPKKLAMADDNQTLYVSLEGSATIRRFDMLSQTPGAQFALGQDNFFGVYSVTDLAVAPGNPNLVAIARSYRGVSPPEAGVAVFDNGIQRPTTTVGHIAASDFLAFSASATKLYGGGFYSGLNTMTINASGVTISSTTTFGAGNAIRFDNGRVYGSTGQVINPDSGTLFGTFSGVGSGPFTTDSAVGRAYFLTGNQSSTNYTITLRAFDVNTFLPVGTLNIPGINGDVSSLVRWGSNGLAFRTAGGQLFLIQTTLVSSADPIPTPTPTPVPTATPTPTPYATFVNQVPLTNNDIAYSSATQLFYASVPSAAGSGGNSIQPINPGTGAMTAPVFIGSEPTKLAMSDDGQVMYAGLEGAAAVRRFNVVSQTADIQFPLGFGSFTGPLFPNDIAIEPGNNNTVAVARANRVSSPSSDGVAIYDNGVPRSTASSTTSFSVEYSNTPAKLYSWGFSGIDRLSADAAGVHFLSNLQMINGGDIRFDGGLLYASNGGVVDPETGIMKGSFTGIGFVSNSIMTTDAANGRAYFLTNSGSTATLRAYDINTFVPLGSVSFDIGSLGTSAPSRLVRWGTNGIAFRTGTRVIFVQSELISSNGVVPAPTPTPSPTATPTPTPAATFVRTVNLPANDLVSIPSSQTLYASVPSVAGSNGNSVTPINPQTGAIGTSVFVGSEPNRMALSDDGSAIHVSLDGAAAIRRFDVATQTAATQFSWGTSNQRPSDMAVVPGSPQSLATTDGTGVGVAIYDNGVQRPNTSKGNAYGIGAIAFASPTILYGYDSFSSGFELAKFTLNSNGVIGTQLPGNLLTGFTNRMAYANGLLYSGSGRVVDPEAQVIKGTFQNLGFGFSSTLTVDASLNRTFYISGGGGSNTVITAFDNNTFLPVGSVTLTGIVGTPVRLVRWGTNGLAFNTRPDIGTNDPTASKVYVLQSALVSSSGTIPTGVQFGSDKYTAFESSGPTSITVTRTGNLSAATTIDYATSDGTATAGSDYTSVSGSLTFAAGETTKTITVPIINDPVYEGPNETFNLTLTNPGGGALLMSPSTTVVTIFDNESKPSINPQSTFRATEGNAGTRVFNIPVNLSNASVEQVSVNYATENVSAQSDDYTGTSGTLTFAPGTTSMFVPVTVTGDTVIEPDETFLVRLSNPVNGNIGFPNPLTVTIVNDDSSIQVATSSYSVTEGTNTLTVSVTRSGDLSTAATVNYSSNDSAASNDCAAVTGKASSRCDYLSTIGTLKFAPTQSAKTLVIPIVDDVYADGPETFTLDLSNPSLGALGATSSATITINDNDSVTGTNPLGIANFFVRLHYIDFLNREPDSSGLAFWSNQITECEQPGATCSAEVRRINVSAAFFLSIEFQETGYLVERIYKSAYGDATGTSNFGPPHQLSVPIVRFNEFLPDTQQISSGVVVGAPGAVQLLEANKVAFTQDFVSRSRFTNAYATSLTPAQFVDALFANAGVTPSAADRTTAINEFGGAGDIANIPARARALRRVAENSVLNNNEKNRAFVLMQYFGYMRRNPNDPQDTDYTGYDFWLTKLNQFNGNFVDAEMVKAFIVSGEYRQRFGP